MGGVPRKCVLLAILAVEALIPLVSAGQTTVADGAEGTSEGEGTNNQNRSAAKPPGWWEAACAAKQIGWGEADGEKPLARMLQIEACEAA